MTREERAYGFIDKIKSTINPSISDKKKIVARRNSPDSGLIDFLRKKKSVLDRKERQAKIADRKGKAKAIYNKISGRWVTA